MPLPYKERRCGNCMFGKRMPADLSKVMCHGEPPRLFMMGGQQTIQGGPVSVRFEAFRPIIEASSSACSLWHDIDEAPADAPRQ